MWSWRKYFQKAFSVSLVLLLSFFGSACTHMMEQPLHEIELQEARAKIDLPVRLVITDDFRNAESIIKTMGDTWIIPLGENLVHDAKQVTRNVFIDPIIPNNGEYTGDVGHAKYTLTPSVLFAEQSYGVMAFSEAKTSIGLEWSISDNTGRQVWVESVQGIGVGISGNVFTYKKYQKSRVQMALQDLFIKSQESMLSSPTLRNLD